MFEKEAEEYLKKDGTKAEQILNMLNEISPLKITTKQLPFVLAMIQQVFQDGAEFGYNKANEWHYVKDKIYPEKQGLGSEEVLAYCVDCVGNYYHTFASYRFDKDLWEDFEEQKVDVIAWKEIVPPKESE